MTVVSYPAGSFIPCCLSTPTCSTINERFNRKAIKCIITLFSSSSFVKAKALRGERRHWGLLGPDALSAAGDAACRSTRHRAADAILWWKQAFVERDCSRLSVVVLPQSSAYGVEYEDWRWFYLPSRRSEVEEAIRPGFAAHLWNNVGLFCFLNNWYFKYFFSSVQMRRWNLKEEDFVLCDDLPAYDLLFRPNCPRTEVARLRPRLGRKYSKL